MTEQNDTPRAAVSCAAEQCGRALAAAVHRYKHADDLLVAGALMTDGKRRALDDAGAEIHAQLAVLSHVKANSPAGAAVQVAAEIDAITSLLDDLEYTAQAVGSTAYCRRAKAQTVIRLLFSALTELTARERLDVEALGIAYLAGETLDPWHAAAAIDAMPARRPLTVIK